MPSPKTILACDLGGTYLRTAPVARGRLLQPMKIHALSQTEKRNPKLLFKRIAAAVGNAVTCTPGRRLDALGLCLPGIVDSERGVVYYARNLNLERIDIATPLRHLFGLGVAVENDSKAAAYGEHLYGAAKGAKDVIYISLGTGLGGALIIDGKIYKGRNNAAGEFGHVSLEADGNKDPYCNNLGCAHFFASGKGLEVQAGTSVEELFDSVRRGETKFVPLIKASMSHLATEIVSLVNAFDPELVVVGGGVIGKSGDVVWPILSQYYKERLPQYIPKRPTLVKAKLYNRKGNGFSGLLGIAALASGNRFRYDQ